MTERKCRMSGNMAPSQILVGFSPCVYACVCVCVVVSGGLRRMSSDSESQSRTTISSQWFNSVADSCQSAKVPQKNTEIKT